MLCNMETISPGMFTPLSTVHKLTSDSESRLLPLNLEAARTVANMQTNTGYSFKNETFRFLAEQLFVFDTFARTTAFGDL